MLIAVLKKLKDDFTKVRQPMTLLCMQFKKCQRNDKN